MNILFTYIRKYLLRNKISTLITIFSISCASAMFFIVTCFGINSITSIYDSSIEMYGNYHALFTNVSDDFLTSLNLHTKIKDVYEIELKKEYETDLIQNSNKKLFYEVGIDSNSFAGLGLKLINGRFPETTHEILVSNDLINNTKDEVDLNLTVQINETDYKIVGIIDSNFLEIDNEFYILISIPENIGNKTAYVNYMNIDEAYRNTNLISNYFINEYDEIKINHNVVFHDLDSTTVTLIFIFFVGFIMFIFMNGLLIVNCYKNSYVNREKHLAILKTIGVTQSQCHKMIMYEGILLLSISLVIGLISGWFLYDVLVYFINILLSNISTNIFVVSSDHKIILLFITILYVSLLSFLSIKQSTKKIITQAVSYTFQSNDEVFVMNDPYLELEKDRDILVRLLRKNIRQNKRSYSPLVMGITLIISIFIFVNSMMGYLREDLLIDSYDQNYDCEVIIVNDYYPTSLMTQFKNASDNVNVVISEKIIMNTNEIHKFNIDYLNLIQYDDEINIDILTYSNTILNSYFPNFNESNYDGIIINETYSLSNRRYYDILDNHTLSLFYEDQRIVDSMKLYSTDKLITGVQYRKNPQIIINNELFRELFNQTNQKSHEYHVYFQSNDMDSLMRYLNKINYEEVDEYSIHNIQENIKSGKIIASLIRFVLYGYVFLLSIMGLLILSCVTTINFDYRKKEFTLFRVMGLRFTEMMQLIFYELLYYASKLFVYSWTLSQCMNFIVYLIYFRNLGLNFFIPMNSLIGSIILFILGLVFFMNYIYLRMKKQKYTQVLKNEISLM